MCGVTGFISLASNLGHIEKMSEAIRHRGPDDVGYYKQQTLSLSHRLLKLFSLRTKAGPYISANKRWVLSFNGEVYNDSQLRKQLEENYQITWNYDTDAEVFLEGWSLEGESFLKKINGMFAFALWDTQEQVLILGRDKMGEKPLYYTSQSGSFYFSSEVKSFKSIGIKFNLNKSRVNEYFAYRYIAGSETLFKDIYKVLPGELIQISCKGSILSKKMWFNKSPSNLPSELRLPLSELAQQLNSLIKKSVQLRTHPSRKNIVFLSSGVDSSLVAHFLPRESLGLTFSEAQSNDLETIRAFCHQRELQHKLVEKKSIDVNQIDEAIWATEEPIGDSIIISNLYLAKSAAESSRVVFSGDGADELFAGYIHHIAFNFILNIRDRFGLTILNIIEKTLRLTPHALLDFITPYSEKLGPEAKLRLASALQQFLTTEQFSDSLSQLFLFDQSEIKSHYRNYSVHSLKDLVTEDQRSWLPDYILIRSDKILMSQSLEGRLPYLDSEIYEFLNSLNSEHLVAGFESKSLFKKATALSLGKAFSTQVKKSFTHTFRMDNTHDLLTSAYTNDLATRENLFKDHLNFIENKKLFSLIVFDRWLSVFDVHCD